MAQRPLPEERLDPTLPESWLGVPSWVPFGLVSRLRSGDTRPPGAGFVDWAGQVLGRLSGKLELAQAFRYTMARREALTAELQAMNSAWETAPPVESAARRAALPLVRLEEIYRTFSYLTRWAAQLEERSVQISL